VPLARAYALVSEAYMLSDQREQAVEWSDRALELAEEVGHRPARVTALVNKGSALIESRQRRQEGIALLELAASEAEVAGLDLLLHRALYNLLLGTVGVWPPERSRQTLRTLRELGERTGRGATLWKLPLIAAEIAAIEGDLAAAWAALQEERRVRLAGLDRTIPLQFALSRARLALEAGEPAEAEAALAEHPLPSERATDPHLAGPRRMVGLELAARKGDLDSLHAGLDGLDAELVVHAWCSPYLGLEPLTPGLLGAIRAGVEPARVRAFLAEAEAAAAELLPEVAADLTDAGTTVAAARRHLEAALLEAEGDPAAALEAYLGAGTGPAPPSPGAGASSPGPAPPSPGAGASSPGAGASSPGVGASAPDPGLGGGATGAGTGVAGQRTAPLGADCQLGAARCLLALGRRELATAHARAAEELLREWPGWRRDEALALLHRLGMARRRAPGPLTPREREVAQLVAQGLSNGEVAKRLFISTKTASVHVSNILAKLGMSSRVEIAAWAVGTGLATVGQPQG
jgi:DNA-binding CsgD family transcriptional regulator